MCLRPFLRFPPGPKNPKRSRPLGSVVRDGDPKLGSASLGAWEVRSPGHGGGHLVVQVRHVEAPGCASACGSLAPAAEGWGLRRVPEAATGVGRNKTRKHGLK